MALLQHIRAARLLPAVRPQLAACRLLATPALQHRAPVEAKARLPAGGDRRGVRSSWEHRGRCRHRSRSRSLIPSQTRPVSVEVVPSSVEVGQDSAEAPLLPPCSQKEIPTRCPECMSRVHGPSCDRKMWGKSLQSEASIMCSTTCSWEGCGGQTLASFAETTRKCLPAAIFDQAFRRRTNQWPNSELKLAIFGRILATLGRNAQIGHLSQVCIRYMRHGPRLHPRAVVANCGSSSEHLSRDLCSMECDFE